MRAQCCACLLLLFAAVPALGHPGVGIVLDSRGNVFYTDLVHVWRIAPDGSKSIAVRNVHTHELSIDSLGNLYGEDSRYVGSDRFETRVWRRGVDGRISEVLPWRDGTYPEYGFTRDGDGAMFWVQCAHGRCIIRRRTPAGRTSTFVPAERFNHNPINAIAAARNGSVYVVDGSDLRRFGADGRATTVAPGLGPALMGLWVDNARTVCT